MSHLHFKLPFYAVTALALYGKTSSALRAEELAAFSSDEVTALLGKWGMDRIFSEQFAAVQVDGESLLNTPASELEDAFSHANIAKMHWNRLHRRLQPLQSQFHSTVLAYDGSTSPQDQVRRLSEDADLDLTSYAGIDIKSNKSIVRFGSDLAIARVDEELVVVASDFTVRGNLNVEGSTNGVSASASLGSSEATAAGSCRAILQLDSEATDGIYWITRLDAETPFQAYCDMSRGGLELVYKITHGVGGDSFDLWETGDGVNEERAYMNMLANDNYVSSHKVSAWDHSNLHAVHTQVMQGNRVARYMTFDPSGTSYTNWFSADTVVASDWTDLMSSDTNFFSIEGDSSYGRRWFVNANYGGCSVDDGWLVLDDETSDPCDWETTNNGKQGSIDILYSPYTTSGNADADYVQADAFAVLVDIDQVFASCQDAMEQLDYFAQDGQYWVDHNGQTDPQIVFCDMTNGAYELIYKASHGAEITDAYALWNGGSSGEDYTTSRLSGHNANVLNFDEHYVSPFRKQVFDSSLDVAPLELDVRIITDGKIQKYLHFVVDSDADDESWFALEYLQDSSWTDITTSDINYFSIAGDTGNTRGWMVFSNYGGCDVDAGWLSVPGSAVCDWENTEEAYPDITYSKLRTKDEANTFAIADMLAVLVKWE